jgi:hypothetical protein
MHGEQRGGSGRTGEADTLPTPTTQYPEQCEVTKTNLEGRDGGDSAMETEMLSIDSAPSRSDADVVLESQPRSPKRPKKLKLERRASRTRNRSASKERTMMTTQQLPIPRVCPFKITRRSQNSHPKHQWCVGDKVTTDTA